MTISLQPGTCRHCACTAESPCKLHTGDECGWHDKATVVCSNPICIKAEQRRVASLVGNGTAQTEDTRQLAVLAIMALTRKVAHT